jgi:hypothetical protein
MVVVICEHDSTYQRISIRNVMVVLGIYLVYSHYTYIYNKQTNIYNLVLVTT